MGSQQVFRVGGCSREGSTAAGRPAVLGTKDGDAEPQLRGMERADGLRAGRTVGVAS